jgi:integrase
MGEIIRKMKGDRFIGYYLRWYEGGKRRQRASKQTLLTEARRMLREIEARVARGEAGIPERATAWPTVDELAARFLSEYRRPKVKDVDLYRRSARAALERALQHDRHLGAQHTHDVLSLQIARLRDNLERKFAPATVRITLAFLSRLFSWAMREGLAPCNPCQGVERPAAPSGLDFLSDVEVRALLDGLAARATSTNGDMLHTCVALAIYTGLRKGELFGLRWSDVDLETRRLTVARSYRGLPKSGKLRHLRLPTRMVPLLRSWRAVCPQSPEGLLFPIGRGATKVASKEVHLGLPGAMKELGLRPLPHPWHALRHTFASHYVMQGGNILALQKILGHADLRMTLIYAHLAPDFLDGEMDRLRF